MEKREGWGVTLPVLIAVAARPQPKNHVLEGVTLMFERSVILPVVFSWLIIVIGLRWCLCLSPPGQ